MSNIEFKDVLKAWREQAGLSQVEAAKRCCASSDCVYAHWEQGEKPLPIVRRLLERYVIKGRK